MSKFTEDLRAALDLTGPRSVSRRYTCPVIYYRADGDRRIDVTFPDEKGRWMQKTIRVRPDTGPLKHSRAKHLRAAAAWAARRGLPSLAVDQWTPTGYPGTWMPDDVHTLMREQLEQWRTARRAAWEAEYQRPLGDAA